MNKISKIATLSLFASTFLFANSDADIISFEKERISQNPNVQVKKVEISTKKALPVKGWNGYILDVTAHLKGKEVNAKDILFSNGEYIALDFIDMKTKRSIKDLVTPDLTSDYYDKKKLIAGNHEAKDKLVIFSDPLCPFCMSYVPDVIEYVNNNKDKIALYYYHFPLIRIHPAANALSKLVDIAKHKGIKDVVLKTYTTNWSKYFPSSATDEKKILGAFNKVFKSDITLDELRKKDIDDEIKKDINMGESVMVQGTPTIFVNGVKDSLKDKYQSLGK